MMTSLLTLRRSPWLTKVANFNLDQVGATYVNRGASGNITAALPVGGQVGDYFWVIIEAGYYVTVNLPSGQMLRDDANVTSTAGWYRSNSIGSVTRIERSSATTWVAKSGKGTWETDA